MAQSYHFSTQAKSTLHKCRWVQMCCKIHYNSALSWLWWEGDMPVEGNISAGNTWNGKCGGGGTGLGKGSNRGMYCILSPFQGLIGQHLSIQTHANDIPDMGLI